MTPEMINLMYEVPDFSDEEEKLRQEEERGMDMVQFVKALAFQGYQLRNNRTMKRCELNTVAKAWSILPTKRLSDIPFDRLRYIYAIKRGYDINLGKMIINTFDILTQSLYSGEVGMVGIITDICKMSGVPPHRTDVMNPCARKVNPATLAKYKAPVL